MKKSFIVLLSVMLVLAMIVGCSSQSGSSGQTGGSNSPSTGGDKAEGNREPIKVTLMMGENSVQPVKPNSPSLEEVLKRTNVAINLEAVPGNFEEKKSALIATNNIPDILQVELKDLQEFAKTGIFLPISDYMEYLPNFQKLIEDRPEINKLKVDGKLYGFPVLEKYRIAVAPQPMIRTDLLEKHNLQVPTTFDELYEVLKALKKEYPDSVPYTTRNGTLSLIGQLAYPMGSGGFPGFSQSPMYYEPDEDKYLYGPIHPDFKKVIAFLNKLYEEELLDPDYAVNTKDMAFEKLSSGRALFYYDNNTFAARQFNPALQQKDPNARIEIIPPLRNDEGQIRSYRYQRDWLTKMYAISSKVKDPVAIVKLYDWLYSDEGTMVSNFGVEGVHYDLVDGVPVVKQSLADQFKNQGDINSAIRSEIGLGLLSYAVHVDETWDALITDKYMLEMGEHIDRYTEMGHIQFMPYDPPFTQDEADQLKKLETKVNTLFQQEIDKFIMGARPMSEFDDFVQKLIDSGAPEIENIYNAAYERVRE
jgi:putative aldouronate transport system substrate-binding protein